MKLEDFQYELPEGLIATHPAEPRDHSRLMVVDRKSGSITHHRFCDLGQFLGAGDFLVLNDTRVRPARLSAEGGKIEILLLEETSDHFWLCIGKPGKKLKPGMRVRLDGPGEAYAEILRTLPDAQRVVRLTGVRDLQEWGRLALPPYIEAARVAGGGAVIEEADRISYQTVYARQEGSVAAPTAGLHFTPELLGRFDHGFVTLHVGLGTFRPVKVPNLEEHDMHAEKFWIPEGLREKAQAAKRVVAVGTTSARVLESVPDLAPGGRTTSIFIYPPYRFKRVDALITNFHLPGSTLLMLVAAFLGHELQKQAYREAVKERYRFYSYGDAMLIL